MTGLMRADVEHATDPETGLVVHRLGDVESLEACEFCGVPLVDRRNGQRTCGTSRCKERLRRMTPERVAARRAKCAEWAARHRNVVARAPWLLGEPPHAEYLPGGGLEMAILPAPQWPIEHRNVRALHGMLTTIIGEPHTHDPEWALVPWARGCGWAVYLRRDEVVERLARRRIAARIFDRDVEVVFSSRVQLRSPHGLRRGHRRVRVDAITPVSIVTDGRARTHTHPTSAALLSTLTQRLPARLGLVAFDRASCVLEVISHSTQPAHVPLGGKFGDAAGWVGSCVVEGNAVARWLLHAAGRGRPGGPGLGSRVAFGFGCVQVEDL